MHHSSTAGAEVIVEDEIVIVQQFSILPQQKCRGIEVKIHSAAVAVEVPSQTDKRTLQRIIERNTLSFFKINGHSVSLHHQAHQ